VNRVDTWRFRWQLARTIGRRDLHVAIYDIRLYATLSATIAIAATLLRNDVESIQGNGFVILSNPLLIPLFGAAVVSSIYLAVASTTTVARERERGTLEVLFYGPVDAVAYLLGKVLAQMGVYALMVAVYLAALALYALIINFVFALNLLLAALLSVATTSAVVTVGILLSTLHRSVRSALLTLLAIALAFLGVQLGHDHVCSLTSGMARGDYNPLLLALQTLFTWLDRIFNSLSPLAYLKRGFDVLLRGSVAEYVLTMGLSLLYSAVAFGLAVWTLRRKGVR